ncbi:glycosyltransferase family 2 protein [Erythrobacter sanguineus]|nr:glycosyltransferase family 2 protein [Erythrobacter sanguineus]
MSRISQQRPMDLLLLVGLRPHHFMANLWWRLLGKKLRARARIDAAIKGLPFAHARWAHAVGIEDGEIVAAAELDGLGPVFCVHCHIARGDDPASVRRTLRSTQEHGPAARGILVTHEAGAQIPQLAGGAVTVLPTACDSRIEGLHAALVKARAIGADWLVPLDSASLLPRHGLAAYGAYLLRQPPPAGAPEPTLLYGDEGEISRFRAKPKLWLKPQWDPRMILSQDYVSRACALAVGPALDVLARGNEGGPQSLYELILRIGEDMPVTHIPRITALTSEGGWRRDGTLNIKAVRRVLGARVDEIFPGPFGTVALSFPLPDPPPTVSVIVATRDRVELLRNCVEGVLRATDYPAIDLIIADNDSVEPEALRYMEEVSADPRVTIVRWPHPFNYSAINNFAASHARSEFLCLLNNDIEVIEPHWLSALVREAMQPGIGAVGARLLYPDRSIQHAGVAIGLGNAAGHAHRALPEGQPGYYAQALIARGASAVTGACLLVSRRHFEAVGGLDEDGLAVAYNDVDLCLKLRERGLTNIYTPAATLIHHESKSRGLDFDPEHLERYMRELKVLQERWDTTRVVDPWHHSGLDRGKEVYVRSVP